VSERIPGVAEERTKKTRIALIYKGIPDREALAVITDLIAGSS
jgi:hypothetical protein